MQTRREVVVCPAQRLHLFVASRRFGRAVGEASDRSRLVQSADQPKFKPTHVSSGLASIAKGAASSEGSHKGAWWAFLELKELSW